MASEATGLALTVLPSGTHPAHTTTHKELRQVQASQHKRQHTIPY